MGANQMCGIAVFNTLGGRNSVFVSLSVCVHICPKWFEHELLNSVASQVSG